MNPSTQLAAGASTPINQLLKLTEAMLICANAGEWSNLEALEAQRGLQLDACFDDPRNQWNIANLEDTVAAVITLNDRVLELVTGERHKVIQEQHKLTSNRARVADYEHEDRRACG